MSTANFGPDESMARNKQNVLIAESCQHLKDTASLRPYQNYADAAMKLLGYHVRNCSLGICLQCSSNVFLTPSQAVQECAKKVSELLLYTYVKVG
jgi:hypothetical protein